MNEEKRLDDFFTYIRLASKCVFKLKSKAVKKKDLKTIHVEILFYLSYKGPLSATEIVKLTLEDKAAVSKALKVLKEREYINYDNKNKYKEKISLTVSGQILARDIQEEATAALFKARRGISDEDAAVFASTLKKICDNLQAYANED